MVPETEHIKEGGKPERSVVSEVHIGPKEQDYLFLGIKRKVM